MKDVNYYTRRFGAKFRKLTDKEVEIYDEYFSQIEMDWLRTIAKEEGLTKKQTQKFIDIMYKVLLVKGDVDERYDNILIGEALRKAKGRR